MVVIMIIYIILFFSTHEVHSRGVHGLDFGFFRSGIRLRPTGSGFRFS